MNSQNYKKYSKSELEEIIKNMNKDLYPKRYKQIEILIKDFQKREESKQRESRVEKKIDSFGWGIFFTFGTFFVLIFGSFPSRVQNSQTATLSIELRLLFAFIFLILAVIFFYKHIKKS